MQENNQLSVKRSISFEKNGETLSIEIAMENVSTKAVSYQMAGYLDVLYGKCKDEFLKIAGEQ